MLRRLLGDTSISGDAGDGATAHAHSANPPVAVFVIQRAARRPCFFSPSSTPSARRFTHTQGTANQPCAARTA